MNDEVPDEGDFDAGRRRGEFDDITPEDFIRGIGNPQDGLFRRNQPYARRNADSIRACGAGAHR
mgnify:CR=1 FL=1